MNCLIQHGGEWLRFSDPVEVLTARTPDEVFQCLEKIETSGLWAAGFVSYEAAGAFDSALKTHPPGALPLLQFGLFHPPSPEGSGVTGTYELGEWVPSVSRSEYAKAIAAIKEHIAAGDTYQVNYTFRLNAEFSGSPFAFFCDLAAAQQGKYAAFIETETFAICSASPELFFELKDGMITSRPMKGTLPRGLTFSKDWKNAEALKNSAKDRAENIMIVDMIRNDIGRIAEAGRVETLSRFDVEKYPTVWQLTSTVQGSLKPRMNANERESLINILKALFPCASITGAPKAKTMELIQGLEKSPRGIYTGAIGFFAPDGSSQFNVAIRTAVIQNGKAEYGIGGGIVWDSDAESEYEEALSKAAILTKKMPEFQLLETMLWEDGEIFLLERHLKRLAESVEYFDFTFNPNEVRSALNECCRPGDLTGRETPREVTRPTKIRLLLSQNGLFDIQTSEIKRDGDVASTLAIAKRPIDSGDLFLYHKTTNRAVYERAKADFPDADDVLLFNERGEVTESTIANVVIELDGRKVTPPVSCGLLAGVLRDSLLESGEITEQIVMRDDLKRASTVWLINSVRKWRRAELVS
jgi:para-aminobenzoate synthetase/4-amino-4-deoxychorismate lyase